MTNICIRSREMKFEVGERYLVKKYYLDCIEVKVLEVSPSGKYIKLEYLSGSQTWDKLCLWEILEKLT